MSVITIAEIRKGIELLQRKDALQSKTLWIWYSEWVLTHFSQTALPITLSIAERYALLQVPNPRPVHDCLIAATAIEHNLTLVTRNVADFNHLPLHIVNPFDALS